MDTETRTRATGPPHLPWLQRPMGQRRRAAPRTEEQNETDASGGKNSSGMNLPRGAGQVNGKRPPGDKGRDSGCGAVSGDDTAMNNQRKVMGEGLYDRVCN